MCSAVVEDGLGRLDIRDEIDDLDSANGGGGAAKAKIVSFLSVGVDDESLESIEPKSVLGQVCIINYAPKGQNDYSVSYVYEALVRHPRIRDIDGGVSELGLLNNYITSSSNFEIEFGSRKITIPAVYYCQQNQVTSVCAHASLKMLLNTLNGRQLRLTTRFINQHLGVSPPLQSLNLQQVESIIEARGFRPLVHDCSKGTRPQYLEVLLTVLDSGYPAILAFTTGHPLQHVVHAFGHTVNRDEWHPQALLAYSGAPGASYYPSSAWVDHYLIHDDNFGPYFSLSSQSLSVDTKIVAQYIIGVLPHSVLLAPVVVSPTSAAILRAILTSLSANGSGEWFRYMIDKDWRYVNRSILLDRARYIDHLKSSEGHDKSKLTNSEIDLATRYLPDLFWCSEFTFPNLYTGNGSKLGEVLLRADSPIDPINPGNSLLGLRVPSLVVTREVGDQLKLYPSSLMSHSMLIKLTEHDHEW